MLRTLLLEVMSCAIKRKFHTMIMFGEKATNRGLRGGGLRGGQPQGIAPTISQCRGNPLWLPLWAHFEAVCVT